MPNVLTLDSPITILMVTNAYPTLLRAETIKHTLDLLGADSDIRELIDMDGLASTYPDPAAAKLEMQALAAMNGVMFFQNQRMVACFADPPPDDDQGQPQPIHTPAEAP